MNPIFSITDSKGGTLNVKNISRDGQHLYQLTSIHGDYAEVSYIRALNSWILTFGPAQTPKFEYDIEEVGKQIQKYLRF